MVNPSPIITVSRYLQPSKAPSLSDFELIVVTLSGITKVFIGHPKNARPWMIFNPSFKVTDVSIEQSQNRPSPRDSTLDGILIDFNAVQFWKT